MKIARSARMRQKRRWRPSLTDIVRRTIRKHMPSIAANMLRNNAFLAHLRDAV